MPWQRPGLDPEHRDRPSPEVRLPRHGHLGLAHPAPTLERRMVAVDHGPHHRADVERLLATGVGLLGEDLTYRAQVGTRGAVRRGADIAVHGIHRRSTSWEALTGSHVGVLVIAEQHLAGARDIGRPVLGLPVGAHDPLVAADPEVVL